MIELETLGGCAIRRRGLEVAGLSTHRQKIALITFLAVEETTSRDRLLQLLWPDRQEERARHALSQALYSLKKELGQELVEPVGDQLVVDPESVTVDVKSLQAAAGAENWGEVIGLYGGPFMDRFYLPNAPGFEEWQASTRAWVGALARRAFNETIAARFHDEDVRGALDVAIQWARLEPVEDEAQHALIALLALSGDRAAALAQYDTYRGALQRELGVEALDATVQMVELIRQGRLPASPLLVEEMATGSETQRAGPAAAGVPAASIPGTGAAVDLDQLVERELEPRLQILRKLGEGTAATVYLAREPGLKRLVALKVFSPRLASDSRARLRFQREVQAIASLRHPNIVTLYWAGALSNGLPYFVMEYVEGRTLRDKLAAEKVLRVGEGRRVLADLASALAAAHRRGLVHRDIKPANVLYEDETGRAMLADFGIVKLLATAEEQPIRITESGELVGDPEWMSPEQLRARRATQRSDLYSLGLVGYTALAGRSPFEAATRAERYAAPLRQEPQPLSRLRPEVDEDTALLLQHCLSSDPSQRPTAAYLAERLRSLAGSAPEWAGLGLIGRLLKRRVPHWLAVYLAGGYGLVELVEILEGRGLFGSSVFDFVFVSFLAGIPLVFVLAWYHGKVGRQRLERLEVWIIGSVLLIWLAVLIGIIG